jgi:hypothetical protein
MDGDKGIEIVYSEEKIFCTWLKRASTAEQKSLVPARKAQRTNQKWTSFISQQGPALSMVFLV